MFPGLCSPACRLARRVQRGPLWPLRLPPGCSCRWQPSVRMVLLVILYAVGSWAAGRTERLLGSKDPSCVVVDELVGQWIALFPLCAPAFSSIMPVFPGPALGPAHVPLIPLAAGFVLFRVFDISKPGAVRKSESWLKGGQGIMIDDVLAGVMALAALCGFCLLWSLAA